MTVTGPMVENGGIVTPANKIILSGDFVAVDSYGRSIMAELDNTFNLDSIQPLLQRAVELGLGIADLTQVEIIEIDTQSVPGMGDPTGPDGFILYPSFPNPFNAPTSISFTLPAPSEAILSVFDASGRKVTTPLNNWRNAGTFQVTFNAGGLASGNYLAMLKAGGFTHVQKLALVK
ncbi:MAG: T9SS type A sorting domain-containing protein [bacterium]|nr:T9SS type A sorting domain-containing protein [bacterium]